MKNTTLKGASATSAHCVTKDPAYNVACYYGAVAAPTVTLEKSDQALLKFLKTFEDDDQFPKAEDVVTALRAFEHPTIQELPQPVTLWHEENKNKKRIVRLDMIGTDKSIAEAALIQTAVAVLEEEGFSGLVVDVNSVGNKDSLAKFQREVGAYYKKNLAGVSVACRQMMKKDSLAAHTCALEEEDEVAFKAPQSISFLSEVDRHHFQEVLEFLERLGLDYRMNNGLVGHRGYATDTIFTISATDDKGGEVIVAAGSRYNNLAKKLGFKKDIPSVGISIYLPPLGKSVKPPKPMKKSPFFFIQLGFDAKLRSLQVIEILRKAKIPLYQSLSRDKLSAQLSLAEFEKFPYVIIMGQKEAIEETVLVRDMNTRYQETVPIAELPTYLKSIS